MKQVPYVNFFLQSSLTELDFLFHSRRQVTGLILSQGDEERDQSLGCASKSKDKDILNNVENNNNGTRYTVYAAKAPSKDSSMSKDANADEWTRQWLNDVLVP